MLTAPVEIPSNVNLLLTTPHQLQRLKSRIAYHTLSAMRANHRSCYILFAGGTAHGTAKTRPVPFHERPPGSFPMVFTIQYRARDLKKEGPKVTEAVSARLKLLFITEVPVYADVRTCHFENPVESPTV
ncbi:hypothetical protein BDV06DRAFT_190287 [Aspergillus oleicola]